MKTEPIELPVKDVRNGHKTESGWKCDVTFGIPDDWGQDDPVVTVTSEDVGTRYPKPGDVMWVYPPHVCGYSGPSNGGGEVGPPEGGPLSTTLLPGRDRI